MGGKEKSLFQAAKVYHRIAVCNALAAVRAGEQVQVQIADIVRIHQKCQLYGCAFAGGEVGEIVFWESQSVRKLNMLSSTISSSVVSWEMLSPVAVSNDWLVMVLWSVIWNSSGKTVTS